MSDDALFIDDPAMQQSAASESLAEYRVLARKYRPATFADLIGQEALVRTLTNAIDHNRLAHAYLLTGLRGIGKTTTARILAKAFNCIGEDGKSTKPTATPCDVCTHCTAIASDSHLDVLEMDAASHTGVANIRDLIDGVAYKPASARFKIYIIDEVHMLSSGAFNALLKTLEEPPPHVKFIFATTDPQKLPVTVLSRCQRFTLPRLTVARLAEHLTDIAKREGYELEQEAAVLLANAAEGSVRDGLSLLDQGISLTTEQDSNTLTTTMVQQMLGTADRGQLYTLYNYLMKGEAAAAIALAANLYQQGAEANAILADLQQITHLLTRLKAAPDSVNLPDLAPIDREHLQPLAEQLVIPSLTRTWQILLKGATELKLAEDPLPALEMLLIRLCYVQEILGPKGGKLVVQGDVLQCSVNSNVSTEFVPPAVTTPAPSMAVITGGNQPAVATAQPATNRHELPASYEELVALVANTKERLLAWHLKNQVRLVAYSPGKLELCLLPEALPGLAIKLGQVLEATTNHRWQIDAAEDPQNTTPTLAMQEAKAAAEALAAACDTLLVQRAKELFPGAEIKLAEIKLKP